VAVTAAADGEARTFSMALEPPADVEAAFRTGRCTMRGAGGRTRLLLNSDAGDPMGRGALHVFGAGDGRFDLTRSLDGAVAFRLRGRAHGDGPPAAAGGAALAPGRYESGAAWPFQGASRPGLEAAGEGRACDAMSGRFVVLEAVDDGRGGLERFAAN